jgi:hypothetical protein
VSAWGEPATGYVVGMQSAGWGNLVWQIKSVKSSAHSASNSTSDSSSDGGGDGSEGSSRATAGANSTIVFGDGGWQIGQGGDACSEWFVENIFEELDRSAGRSVGWSVGR